jgi:hypothetical protein
MKAKAREIDCSTPAEIQSSFGTGVTALSAQKRFDDMTTEVFITTEGAETKFR